MWLNRWLTSCGTAYLKTLGHRGRLAHADYHVHELFADPGGLPRIWAQPLLMVIVRLFRG